MGNIHPCCSGSMRIQLKVLTVVLRCLLLSRRAAAVQFEFKSQSEERTEPTAGYFVKDDGSWTDKQSALYLQHHVTRVT